MAKEFTYTMKIDAEIGMLTSKLKTLQSSLSAVMGTKQGEELQQQIGKIEKAIDSLRMKASQPIKTEAAFSSMRKDLAAIGLAIAKATEAIDDLKKLSDSEKVKLLPEDTQKKISAAIKGLETYNKTLQDTQKLTKELKDANSALASAQKKVSTRQDAVTSQEQTVSATKRSLSGAKGAQTKANRALDAAKSSGASAEQIADLEKKAEDAARAVEELTKTLTSQEKTLNGHRQALQDAQVTLERVKREQAAVQSTFDAANTQKLQASYEAAKVKAQELGVSLEGLDGEVTPETFAELTKRIEEFVHNAIEPANHTIEELTTNTNELKSAASDLGKATDSNEASFKKENEAAGQVSGFAARIKQFVGMAGAMQLARRVMQNAISTIKELDAQMTEMAVVTNESVGGYWDQLPEYTHRANKLGVSIKAAYEAATLYYQQGLKTNQVIDISNSTLKMARIAGLNAAEATDRMTAALRGFNMEINQTNADRVADVYSKLAAITASNVDEISTAMTKTASIASSANMEFETTAAFLSQIIETTRESAETAGTALKTVIARFQELKKSPDEIGEIDGEIIDANKIETALRSVGVALRDASGQFRDLDDVFLELSSKWDALDTNTQRYIATIAAGSRQQSRFIAMMSDYSRTTELVNAANAAAGTSNQQFEKTLESLESKVEKLKNSWNTFTMGLLNSDIIKGAIDLLNGLLNAINTLTQGWDSFSGGALKVGLLTTALILGDKALKIFLKSFAQSKSVLGSIGTVFSSAAKSIKKTIQPFGTYNGVIRKNIKYTSQLSKVQTKSAKLSTELTEGTNRHIAAKRRLQRLNEKEAVLNEKLNAQSLEDLVYSTLTEEQHEAAVGIEELGNKVKAKDFTTTSALLLAKQGYTAQMIEEMAASAGVTTAQMAEILAKKAEARTTLGGVIASKLLTLSKKLEGKSVVSSAAAKFLDYVATQLLKMAMWELMLVILVVIAAIVLLVVAIMGIIAAIKKAQANSPEGKLKSAREALAKVSEAANDATDSYKNLTDSLKDLKDQYDALDELTVGTQEWRDAVMEVNKQVTDLINQYPELAALPGAIQTDENGVMRITQEAQDSAIAASSTKAMALQNAALAQQIEVKNRELDVDYKNLSDKAKVGNQAALRADQAMGYLFGGPLGAIATQKAKEAEIINKDATKSIAAAISRGEFAQTDTDEIAKRLRKEFGYGESQAKEFAKELSESGDELKKFGDSINAATEANKAYYKAMASNAIIGAGINNQESQNVASNILDESVMQSFLTSNSGQTAEIKKSDFTKKGGEIEQELKKLYGSGTSIDNKGNVTYTKSDGSTETITMEQAKAQLGASRATKQMQEAAKNVQAVLDTNDSIVKKALQTKNGKNLSQRDLEKMAQITFTEKEGEGYELINTEMKIAFESMKRTAELEMRQASKVLNERLQNTIDFNKEFSIEAISGLSSHFETILSTSGEQAVHDINDQLNTALTGYTEAQRETIVAQLNAIDWTDASGLEALGTTLKELGINASTSLNELIDSIKESANAIHKITWEDLTEQNRKMGAVVANIRSGEQGRNFDDEAYKSIVASNSALAKSFVQNLDGSFTYIGKSMDDLTQAINENTQTLLEEKRNNLHAIQILSTMKIGNYTDNKINDIDKATKDDIKNWFTEFYRAATNKGLNIEDLQIEGLGNDYGNISTLSESKLKDLYGQIQAKFGSYSFTAWDDYIASNATTYQKNSNIQNAANLKATMANYTGTDAEQAEVASYFKAIIAQGYQQGLDESYLNELQEDLDKFLDGDKEVVTKYSKGISTVLSEFIVNSYEAFYGAAQQIQEATNKFTTELEYYTEQYDDLIEKSNLSASEVTTNLEQQYSILNSLKSVSTAGQAEAYTRLTELEAKNSKYLTVNQDENGIITIDINEQAAIDDGIDVTVLNEIKEDGQQLADEYNSYAKSTRDYERQQLALEKKSEKSKQDLISKTRDALIETKQQTINALSSINEAINDAASEVLNTVRTNIEESRNERTKEESKQNILDQYAQLAALQAEGGHELEILQLEKSIADAEQAYQDSLIDEELSAMEKANQEAADQRQQQIDIQTSLLEYWQNNGQAWLDAQEMVNSALNGHDTPLFELFETTKKGMASWEREDFDKEVKTLLGEANATFSEGQQTFLTTNLKPPSEQKLESIGTSITNAINNNTTVADSEYVAAATSPVNSAASAISALTKLEAKKSTDEQQGTFTKADEGEYTKAKNNLRAQGAQYLQQDIGKLSESDLGITIGQDGTKTVSFANDTKAAEYKSNYMKLGYSEKEAEAYVKKYFAERYDEISQTTRQSLLNSIENATVQNIGNYYDQVKNQDDEIKMAYLRRSYDLLATSAHDTNMLKQGLTPWVYLPWGNDHDVRIPNGGSWHSGDTEFDKAVVSAAAPGQLMYDGVNLVIRGTNADYHRVNATYKDEMLGKIKNSAYDLTVLNDWKLKMFKTGGLADFTGPAWMDGTASAPELVLNAQDTQNFIALKDVLASFMQNAAGAQTSNETTNGDAYIDVDINVDTLSSDYDVDEVARRVEDIINQDARYRNVTNAKTSR